jgi:MFS family permease
MEWKLYFALSFVMFMEYAVWAAWMPVLAARLLGPLKMTGKQTGWIYATFPLACIFMPLVSGQLADKYVNTENTAAGQLYHVSPLGQKQSRPRCPLKVDLHLGASRLGLYRLVPYGLAMGLQNRRAGT